jgi:hypothetical protein
LALAPIGRITILPVHELLPRSQLSLSGRRIWAAQPTIRLFSLCDISYIGGAGQVCGPYHFMKSGNKKWNSQKLIAKVEIPVATSARCVIRLISRPINSFGGREGAFSGMDRVGASVARSFVVNGSRGGLVANAIQPRRSYAFARICPINRCVEYGREQGRDSTRRFTTNGFGWRGSCIIEPLVSLLRESASTPLECAISCSLVWRSWRAA